MPARNIALLIDKDGNIVDATRHEYAFQLQELTNSMRPGDTLEMLERRLSAEDIKEIEAAEARAAANERLEEARKLVEAADRSRAE